MTIQVPLRFYGEYCSPYTRKMLSLLRYRGISYQLLQGGPGGAPPELPKPKVDLLPTFYLANEQGETEAVVDSTPLIRRFEQDFEKRSAIPGDAALAFVDYLLAIKISIPLLPTNPGSSQPFPTRRDACGGPRPVSLPGRWRTCLPMPPILGGHSRNGAVNLPPPSAKARYTRMDIFSGYLATSRLVKKHAVQG